MPARILRDQRVVIIGGSSGIGFAVARGALDDGARVVIGSSGAGNVEAATKRLMRGGFSTGQVLIVDGGMTLIR